MVPLRLGLVTGEYPPLQGGVGDFTRELARALTALSIEVHVITRRTAPGLADPGVVVHPVIGRWSWTALAAVRRLARTLQLTHLNLQYQAAAYDLAAPIHFLPDWAGLPTLVTFHDLRIPYLFPKAGALRPWAVTHLARRAAGVVVTDPADGQELQRRGLRAAAIRQIPIGSNIAVAPPPGYSRAAWRARWGVAASDCLLGYFGFLNASKGGDVLLDALLELRTQGLPAKLMWIGGQTGASDGANNAAFGAELTERIRQTGLETALLHTGFVTPEEVSAHLLACDVLILPYRDGASFRRGTLMAALAHGCCIVTTEPATPWPLLQDRVNVRLVPPAAATATAAAVAELWQDPAARVQLGQGAAAASTQFSWGTIAARTLEFLQGL